MFSLEKAENVRFKAGGIRKSSNPLGEFHPVSLFFGAIRISNTRLEPMVKCNLRLSAAKRLVCYDRMNGLT